MFKLSALLSKVARVCSNRLGWEEAGRRFASTWQPSLRVGEPVDPLIGKATGNPLRQYFEGHKDGPGIWKWSHYFDAYHRHLAKFVGREVSILEIGIYSGGSLGMWRSYFGPACTIYGVDIEPACMSYAGEGIKVYIGDQADRTFWKRFRDEVPRIDVVIDDGGHTDYQQITTLEEVLYHVHPGGVYICEDVHGVGEGFTKYAQAIADHLNAAGIRSDPTIPGRFASFATPLQAEVQSVHFYPYMTVIEKTDLAVKEFEAVKHGTQWQPFL